MIIVCDLWWFYYTCSTLISYCLNVNRIYNRIEFNFLSNEFVIRFILWISFCKDRSWFMSMPFRILNKLFMANRHGCCWKRLYITSQIAICIMYIVRIIIFKFEYNAYDYWIINKTYRVPRLPWSYELDAHYGFLSI